MWFRFGCRKISALILMHEMMRTKEPDGEEEKEDGEEKDEKLSTWW